MKKKLILTVLFAVSSSAFARTFSVAHDVVLMSYADLESCRADGYEWQGPKGDGLCILKGVDTVSLKKNRTGYTVIVETITTNAHSCSYESKNAKFIDPTRLVSSVRTMVYDQEGNAKPGVCEVTVNSNKDHSVSVTTNGYAECSEFCGMNASLDIEGATNSHY